LWFKNQENYKLTAATWSLFVEISSILRIEGFKVSIFNGFKVYGILDFKDSKLKFSKIKVSMFQDVVVSGFWYFKFAGFQGF
jgi:hypothetical protein